MQLLLAEDLARAPVVPVIVIDRAGDAVPLARTLVEAGLPLVEITLRTPAAPAAIAAVAEAVPEAVVGAGSVLGPADVALAREAGARFAVSPGATPALLAAAEAEGLPLLPGAATASEVMALLERGFRHLKFFPAVPAGGPAALAALAGPLPLARFVPTGGIDAEGAAEWLALPNVVAVGGSWIAPRAAIRAGDWALIGERARAAAALVRR
ncbi:MAG: bifunctional 4-hydroxy-2-oxoglutarate aldolase/2-dehydro-3-deoxy-phosphogluconate aldolase [Alphaproteobacteria bacterium]|nr:MAG: bifunctional 4-hydroxy-2-oxoglutarate aldolase/2-dehydro-3-deoxy-phosphogluconate aldolase [Alphaproteobacteria bacterium]